jgi:hypothetical protein
VAPQKVAVEGQQLQVRQVLWLSFSGNEHRAKAEKKNLGGDQQLRGQGGQDVAELLKVVFDLSHLPHLSRKIVVL